MHVEGFLHKLFATTIHKTRLSALITVVIAAINTKSLRLTTIGRGIVTGIQERSGIQKVNRLLRNKHLLKEYIHICIIIASLLIGNKKYPKIIGPVDNSLG